MNTQRNPSIILIAIAIALFSLLGLLPAPAAGDVVTTGSAVQSTPARGEHRAGQPVLDRGIRFRENNGQIVDTDGKVRHDVLYTAESNGTRLFLRSDGISYVFSRSTQAVGPVDVFSAESRTPERLEKDAVERAYYRMDMNLLGGNANPRIRTEDPVEGVLNFYLGHCPDGVLGVREYRKLIYENVYWNIDMEMLAVNGRMKYNFIVRPGGNAKHIRMEYGGAADISVSLDGNLRIRNPLGGIEEAKPLSYHGHPDAVIPSRFVSKGNVISFDVAGYDTRQTLVIDPWATYYGGSEVDHGSDVATDAYGNVVVTGYTKSLDLPVQSGVQSSIGGGNDAFIVKFNSLGVRQWATYYGGQAGERSYGITTNGSGNIFVTGFTASPDFPVHNAYQSTYQGDWDVYVINLNPNGSVQWATYYGGMYGESGQGIAIDGTGNVVVSGTTWGNDFPVLNAQQSAYGGGYCDAVAMKFNPAGSLLWATYAGGSAADYFWDVVTDSQDNIIIAGDTRSGNYPVLNAQQPSYAGGYFDGVIAKYNMNGTLQWCTYYGGSGSERAWGIDVDEYDNLGICGPTTSTDLPVLNAHQGTLGGANDAYVMKLNPSGIRVWATYYGGSDVDLSGYHMSIDGNGDYVVPGWTMSTDFPVQNAMQPSFGGGRDAFIMKFDGAGNLKWSTYYGGSGNDIGWGLTTDYQGNVLMTGRTSSTDFPVFNGFSGTYSGGSFDAFVVHCRSNGMLNSPPVALCSDVTVKAGSNCSANASVDNGSSDPDGDPVILTQNPPGPYPVGSTLVTLTATDPYNLTSSCTATVTVIDAEEPQITASVLPSTLWPANHKMKDIAVVVTAGDNCSGSSWVLTSITSNEADNGLGDGDHPNDIQEAEFRTADVNFRLRAERSGTGNGRVYTIIYTATDASMNTATATVTVTVPHDMGKMNTERPCTVFLDQNYPNPFNPQTTIRYSIPVESHVALTVFDTYSRKVVKLVDAVIRAGSHKAVFDASNLPSGVYLYRLEAGGQKITRMMTLMK